MSIKCGCHKLLNWNIPFNEFYHIMSGNFSYEMIFNEYCLNIQWNRTALYTSEGTHLESSCYYFNIFAQNPPSCSTSTHLIFLFAVVIGSHVFWIWIKIQQRNHQLNLHNCLKMIKPLQSKLLGLPFRCSKKPLFWAWNYLTCLFQCIWSSRQWRSAFVKLPHVFGGTQCQDQGQCLVLILCAWDESRIQNVVPGLKKFLAHFLLM